MANKRNCIEVTDDHSSVHVRRMSSENYASFNKNISIAFIIKLMRQLDCEFIKLVQFSNRIFIFFNF